MTSANPTTSAHQNPGADREQPRPAHVAPIALSLSAHDRVAGRRTDDAWLADVWAADDTKVLLLHGARLIVPDGPADAAAPADSGSGDPPTTQPLWASPKDAPPGQRLLLGEKGGTVRFALMCDELPDGHHREHLRAFIQTLDEDDAALVVHAVALAEWHRGHRFCPRCGAELEVSAAGHMRVCPSCGRQHFPRTDPAVIMLVTDEEDRCLLGHQPSWPEGRYSTLAGFVEPGESLEQAVRREVEEEVGVVVDEVRYFGNQPWPFPASLMVGFFAVARTTELDVDGEEIADARWFTREEMRQAAEAGTIVLPGGISISRALVETWYGGPLPGSW